MAKFIPTTTDLTAPEFAALLHENMNISDRDTRITSKAWPEICAYSLTKRKLSTAFHPQIDNQTEILNRILGNYLRAYTNLEHMNWAKLLPNAEFAYNNSRSSSTKMTLSNHYTAMTRNFELILALRTALSRGRHQQHTTESHASLNYEIDFGNTYS